MEIDLETNGFELETSRPTYPRPRGSVPQFFVSTRAWTFLALWAFMVVVLTSQVGVIQQRQKAAFEVPVGLSRCYDDDDLPEMYNMSTCSCPDPHLPTKRRGPGTQWFDHHERLVEQAQSASLDLDVVILGDSIIERLNGTRGSGAVYLPEYAENFAKNFHKDQGADIEGLALGSAGDTTTELLFHLQNGTLPDRLHPKVWMILIGTNNIGEQRCSKHTVLTGIVEVLSFLQKSRPGAPILVHGLLPRAEYSDQESGDYPLGRKWSEILWINTNLRRYCRKLSSTLHYFEANNLFLRENNPGDDMRIIRKLMPDGLHPSLEGYLLWTAQLVQQIKNMLVS